MKSAPLRNTREAGFTLLEILVVLAVIGALVATMAPLTFNYINDARRTQAQNDVNQIASAIGRFLESTGVPPYKNENSTEKVPAKESDDYFCLRGASGDVFSADDDSTDGDTWSKCWSATLADRDSIENHLIANTPGGNSGNYVYRTTGKNKWEGPYLSRIDPDPWGKQYLVNIGQMDPTQSKAVFVISAGPNSLLETTWDQSAGASISPGGDDIIARVK